MAFFCIGFFLGLGLGLLLARAQRRSTDHMGLAQGAALNPFKDDLLFASCSETDALQLASPGEESMTKQN